MALTEYIIEIMAAKGIDASFLLEPVPPFEKVKKVKVKKVKHEY